MRKGRRGGKERQREAMKVEKGREEGGGGEAKRSNKGRKRERGGGEAKRGKTTKKMATGSTRRKH